ACNRFFQTLCQQILLFLCRFFCLTFCIHIRNCFICVFRDFSIRKSLCFPSCLASFLFTGSGFRVLFLSASGIILAAVSIILNRIRGICVFCRIHIRIFTGFCHVSLIRQICLLIFLRFFHSNNCLLLCRRLVFSGGRCRNKLSSCQCQSQNTRYEPFFLLSHFPPPYTNGLATPAIRERCEF